MIRQLTDRQLKDAVAKYAEKIQKATSDVPQESEKEKAKRIEKLLNDPKKFQEYYFPYLKETPEYIIKAAKKLLKNKDFFGWWQMFRGARKTTWLSCILPLMMMARGEMKFMVLIGINEKQAKRLLGNIHANLTSNLRFIADFGAQKQMGSWEDLEFTTLNGVSFVGMGMGQSPRGLNKNMTRPDYILGTDLDSKALSKNPARCKEMYDWLMEDLMGTIETGGEGSSRFVFDNNYFSKTSIGHLLKELNSDIEIIQVDIMDKAGNPVAPFITKEWIAKKLKRIGYFAFQREYMNNPLEEGTFFKAEQIIFRDELPLHEYDAVVFYVDPTWKSKKTSDTKAISVLGKRGAEYDLLRVFCRRADMPVMTAWHYDKAFEFNANDCYPVHYIEGSFNQDELVEDYDLEGQERGVWLDIMPDLDRKGDKTARIKSLQPLFLRQRIFFSNKLKEQPDWETAKNQLLGFEEGSNINDDFPDSLHGAKVKLDKLAYATKTRGKDKNNYKIQRRKSTVNH
jgi:phage terminase large subunit-like protein